MMKRLEIKQNVSFFAICDLTGKNLLCRLYQAGRALASTLPDWLDNIRFALFWCKLLVAGSADPGPISLYGHLIHMKIHAIKLTDIFCLLFEDP